MIEGLGFSQLIYLINSLLIFLFKNFKIVLHFYSNGQYMDLTPGRVTM